MSTTAKAVILAAGMGTRLQPLTLDHPKCLLEVGGKPLIARQVELLRAAGISDVVVVLGYMPEKIREALGDSVRYREYPDFASTNNLHTLWHVRDELQDGFVCLFSDVLFPAESLQALLALPEDVGLMIDTARVLEGTMRVRLENGKLTGIGSHIPVERGSGNFLGVSRFSSAGAEILIQEMEPLLTFHQQDYYTLAIDRYLGRGGPAGFVDLNGAIWCEIDTLQDLETARRFFP